MKTVPDLLRDADPLGHEPRRSAQELRASRQRVLDAPRVDDERPRRRTAIAVVGALVVGGLAGGSFHWLSTSVDVAAAVRFEVRLAEENPAPGLREVVVSNGRKIYLHQDTIVANSDIARAQVVPGNTPSTFNVALTFTSEGAAKMSRATQNHVGKPVAILLDGDVVMAPTLKSPIVASAMLTGMYTRAEADRIVAGIIGR